jgi:hypothetical protein
MIKEYGVVDEMRIGKGKPKYSNKACPGAICPPQIHYLNYGILEYSKKGYE